MRSLFLGNLQMRSTTWVMLSLVMKEILYLFCNRQLPRGCIQDLNTRMCQARLLQLDGEENHEEPTVKRVVKQAKKSGNPSEEGERRLEVPIGTGTMEAPKTSSNA